MDQASLCNNQALQTTHILIPDFHHEKFALERDLGEARPERQASHKQHTVIIIVIRSAEHHTGTTQHTIIIIVIRSSTTLMKKLWYLIRDRLQFQEISTITTHCQ